MPQSSLTDLLQLTSPPVAITFADAPPAGVKHVSAGEPAGCGYWRRAAQGEVFFTVADDHKRCPVGAHTHNVTLSPSEQQELMGLVQTMVDLSYIKMEEVPRIPTRKTPLQVAVYAPLVKRAGATGRRAGARQCPAVDAPRRSRTGCWRRRRHGDDGPANVRRPARSHQLGTNRRQLRLRRQPCLYGRGRNRSLFSGCRVRTSVQ